MRHRVFAEFARKCQINDCRSCQATAANHGQATGANHVSIVDLIFALTRSKLQALFKLVEPTTSSAFSGTAFSLHREIATTSNYQFRIFLLQNPCSTVSPNPSYSSFEFSGVPLAFPFPESGQELRDELDELVRWCKGTTSADFFWAFNFFGLALNSRGRKIQSPEKIGVCGAIATPHELI